jgi:hypothetical protein
VKALNLVNGVIAKVDATAKIIEAGKTNADMGLDDFIQAGRDKLARGELVINSQTFLTAIKIKKDDEKSNKDRKVDLLRTMFSGAGPSGPPATT